MQSECEVVNNKSVNITDKWSIKCPYNVSDSAGLNPGVLGKEGVDLSLSLIHI